MEMGIRMQIEIHVEMRMWATAASREDSSPGPVLFSSKVKAAPATVALSCTSSAPPSSQRLPVPPLVTCRTSPPAIISADQSPAGTCPAACCVGSRAAEGGPTTVSGWGRLLPMPALAICPVGSLCSPSDSSLTKWFCSCCVG